METDVRVGQVIVSLAFCAPCVIPAGIIYIRHRSRTPEGQRFPLWLYAIALLVCAWFALWVGIEQGSWFAFEKPAGSFGWLFGAFLAGPLTALFAVSLAAWSMTFSPREMKRIAPVALVLGLAGGAYHFRYEFFGQWLIKDLDGLLMYRLQSADVDALQRYAPMTEAQLRDLPILKDVCLDSELTSDQAIIARDPRPKVGMLPTRSIKFRVVPPSTLDDVIKVIAAKRVQLGIPKTFESGFGKAQSYCH
jgi:hypothetical protein